MTVNLISRNFFDVISQFSVLYVQLMCETEWPMVQLINMMNQYLFCNLYHFIGVQNKNNAGYLQYEK